jgi:hypothetical protein
VRLIGFGQLSRPRPSSRTGWAVDKVRCHSGLWKFLEAGFLKCCRCEVYRGNRFHIWKSFKSCWIGSCYRPPTRPRSALSKTVLLWCATLCGNISSGWSCEPVKSATGRATRDNRRPMRKRGLGIGGCVAGRIARGQIARGGIRLYERRETAGPRAHPQQRHRVLIHGHGCAGHFHDSRGAI